MKIKKRAKEQFEFFSRCEDKQRLPKIELVPSGHSALECFHIHESTGKEVPCREPELLSRALNGKQWHGLTVSMVAEDLVDCLITVEELSNYPRWIYNDMLNQAKKLAQTKLGFVPKFLYETPPTPHHCIS